MSTPMAKTARSVGPNSISELRRLSNELKILQDERQKRLRARNSLLTYASSIEIPTVPTNASIEEDREREEFIAAPKHFGAHHLLWIDCLQKVEDGQIKRLMGLMPPGSAKSTYTSVVYPTHFLGRFPKRSIIVARYGSDLPKKFGRGARSIVQQPKFKRIFDCGLSEESAAVDEWSLTNGSEWMAAAILTGITGNSGESGWIKCRDGNDWYVVCLPAICERNDDPIGRKIGERIWPEWFPEDHFEPFKRQPRTWSALYQQRPAPDTGDFFQGDWLNPGPGAKAPDRDSLHIYGASDYAVSEGKGDYTVHIVVGVDHAGRIFLLDLWRQQAASDKWVEVFCDLVQKWKPLGWAEEKGQIKGSVGPFLQKRLRERKIYIARAEFPTKGDKSIRAQSIRGRMAMDGLYCPFHLSWFSEFKRELMTFPAGKNDDMVDALGLIGKVLDKMVPGRKRADPDVKPKLFSTNPADCTVTLTDMFEANERRRPLGSVRIH